MTPTLETPRLTLRPRGMDDAPRHAMLLNDHDIVRMLTAVPWPYTQADSEEWLSGVLDEPGGIDLLIDDGQGVIGAISLSHVSPAIRSLGFWIGKSYWGRGLVSEAATALIDWGFRTHDLEKIVSTAFIDNAGSRRVHAKLGFTETGTKPLDSQARDAQGEAVTFALTRTDWIERR